MTYESITERNLSEGIQVYFDYLNSVTSQWFSNMILIGLYMVALFGISRYNGNDFIEAGAIAGFLTVLVSIFLWLAGMVSGVTFLIVIAVCILNLLLVLFVKK